MDAKLLALIFAERVVVDDKSQNPSLINIFNNINTKGLPAKHPEFTVLCDFVSGDNKSHNGQFKVVKVQPNGADGKEILVSPEVQIKQEKNLDVRFVQTIRGLTFPEEGKYEVRFFLDNKLLAERTLTVTLKAKD